MFEWIDWIGHWDEMRFYYSSVLSWLILLPLYVGGLVVLGLLAWLLTKIWKYGWALVIPLIPVLAIWPWWEEYNIAWNFGQLCKKDAGIFIYKTVEVEGFYDDTRPARPLEPTAEAKASMDTSGYRFHERTLANRKGNSAEVVRFEKIDGAWKVNVLDKPTARYHYRRVDFHTPIAHEVKRFENAVIDVKTGDVLGQYVNYYRGAPWFFIGLDKPTIPCEETENDTRKYGTILVSSLVFGHGPTREEEEDNN